MHNIIPITINDLEFFVSEELSILEACKYVGINVPRFCYHETLSIPGNCRMCLVEIEDIEKPRPSCLAELVEDISIYTESLFVKKARQNVLETLLLNHPLDCPICDQAGECDLQDQAKTFGVDHSRFRFDKRGVEDKDCGPLIKTIMTRCIHCTRCVRFGSEVAGIDFLGTLNRGRSTEIGGFVAGFFNSEISGNVIDLCPVGALTSKPYGFKSRPWELKLNETTDITDSTGSNIYINFKELEIFRVLPKNNNEINEHIISDKARFSYDANTNNRIQKIIKEDENSSKYLVQEWKNAIIDFDNTINQKKNVYMIANEDIGLENLSLLKKISFLYKNIFINSLKNNTSTTNLYIYGLTDKIEAIENCNDLGLLFSVNPKVESAIVNTRLRTQYRESTLDLLSFTRYFSYNIPTKFIQLNLCKSLSIFEGKFYNFSEKWMKSEVPLLIIGDYFHKRGIDGNNLISSLKFQFNNVKILKINESINIESINYLNIKNIVRNKFHTTLTSLFCFNLNDTFSVRQVFSKLKKNIFWFNTHGSSFISNVKYIIPLLSEFEDDRVVLNLEQRPLKINKTFLKYFDARSVKKVIYSVFNRSFINLNMKNSYFYLKFLFEMVKTPELFANRINNFSFLIYKNFTNINFLYHYPVKATLEDFHCGSKTSKNSIIMQKSSQTLRKLSNNFN